MNLIKQQALKGGIKHHEVTQNVASAVDNYFDLGNQATRGSGGGEKSVGFIQDAANQ